MLPRFKDIARQVFAAHGILPAAVAGKMPLGGTGWNLLSLADRLVMFDAAMCTGLGLQCGLVWHPKHGPVEVRVIDIDEKDEHKRLAFVTMLLHYLGTQATQVVWRWGRGPACIVFVRGHIPRERYGSIQLLGAGKQAVWWGAHPETQRDYQHPDGHFMDGSHEPPVLDANALDQYLIASCTHAQIAVEGPGTDYDEVAERGEDQFEALTEEDLARYRAEFVTEINAVLKMPEGSGRGTRLYGIGNRFGWLSRHDAQLEKLVNEALAVLPGHKGAGDVRDLTSGLDDSKGLAQSGQAARNLAYRQFVQDWRTGQPRAAVIDSLRAGKRAERRPSTLKALLQRPVEPLTQVVEGLVPSKGLFLIAADPKAGKSYLATDMLISVSEGSLFVGMQCVQGSTMYIALEETHSEFMDRLHKIRPGKNFASIENKFRAVFFDEGVPRLEADFKGGLLEFMDDMLAEDPAITIFVLDTLQHALGDIEHGQSGKNSYKIEYEAIGWLQKYALSRNVCIVLLHHTNKSKSDSAGQRISGSTGIPAAVSGFMELQVPDENPYVMTARGRVRGVGIFKHDWVREENVSVWSPTEGPALSGRGVKEKVFSTMIAANCELTPADIAMRMKIDERVAAARLGDLRKEGRLHNPRRGVYCIPGARPRIYAIAAALMQTGKLQPATTEAKALHDPEGKFSHYAGMDAERFGLAYEVEELIESCGFHNGSVALKELNVHRLAVSAKNGSVWFFGDAWRVNQSQQTLPWSAPPAGKVKTPWSA